MDTNEFFIGWMPKAPAGFATHIRKVLTGFISVVVVAGTILAIAQKKFSSANFEFGRLTEVTGIFFERPVPCLKVVSGKTIFGQLNYITIPLIGYGKSGADGLLRDVQHARGVLLNQKAITVKGTLLYNDGKLLLQLDGNDSFLVNVGATADSSVLPVINNLGEQTIRGEIVDPKCFFGVMKPGQGKPHKDCAIRCILGGIPPVLKVMDKAGNENYYLVVGPNGEKMNEAVRNYIAEPVSVKATVVKQDDWIVLYVQEEGIARYSYLQEHFGSSFASCGDGASCSK